MADVPSLEQFIAQAKPLNPAYSDADLTAQYHKMYPPAPVDGAPSLDDFVAQAKPLNPGYSDDQIKEQYTKLYGAPKEEGSDFLRGAEVGMKQLVPTMKGAVGLLGATAEEAVGAGGIATKVKNWGLNGFKEGMEKIQPLQHENDELTTVWKKVTEEGDLGALKDFVAYGLGYGASQLAQTAAVGIGGAIVGGPLGAISGIVEQTAAKGLIAQWVEKAVIKRMAQGMARETAVKSIARDMGALTAMGGFATGQEMGQIYPEANTESQKTGDPVNLARVWGASAVAGASELIPEAYIFGKAIGRISGGPSRIGRTIAGGTTGATLEAGQEAFQTGVEHYGAGEPIADEAGLKDIINSAGLALVGGGSAGATAGLISPTPKTNEPPSVEPIIKATSTDEAIAKAKALVEEAPVTTEQLDQVIKEQQTEGKARVNTAITNAELAGMEAQHADDRVALGKIFSLVGEENEVTTDERGNQFYRGAPIDVVTKTSLPDTTPPDGGLSKEKLDVLESLASAMGKRVVVYADREEFPHGVTHQQLYPTTIFMSDKVVGTDYFSVFAHEALHLHEGTPFHEAFRQAVWENLAPGAKELALERHGELPHDALLNEIAADIQGTELHKPALWQKVYQQLQEKVGDDSAKKEMLSFIDTLKSLVAKIKEVIASHPWSTGFGKDKRTLAEQYVTDLDKVHHALAAGVADAIYQTRTGSEKLQAEKGILSLKQTPTNSPREVIHPRAVRAFTKLAEQQRGAPEMAMLKVQRAMGGGVMNVAIEHTGDLIHRMTELTKYGSVNQYTVQQKVDRVLNMLKHPYGFEKEHHENLTNNASYYGKPVGEVRTAVRDALLKYADEHQKLPVYNLPQWLAREASIALGRGRYEDAIRHLTELKALASSKEFGKAASAYAKEGYLKPIPVKLVGVTPGGKVNLTTPAKYTLEAPVPGKKIGDTVDEAFLKAEGYHPMPTDLVSKDEAIKTRKSLKETGKAGEVYNPNAKGLQFPSKNEANAQPTETKEEYDYASTQIDLAPALAKKVLAIGQKITTEDLAEKGRETEPHITVKYGLHDENPAQARAVLSGSAPVRATIGDLDFFETEDGDVLVLKVDSPQLHDLNQQLTDRLENTTERAYQPHITVAYLKEGKGQEYVDSLRNPLKGSIVDANAITFSDKQGQKTEISLGTTAILPSVGHPVTLSPKMKAEDRAFAKEYDNAPVFDKAATPAWDALKRETARMYDDIVKKVNVERVTGQPYPDAKSMNADIKKGNFKVTTDHSEHPVWNVDDNFKFRVVHDYIGHFETGFDFSMAGERAAYEHHAAQLTSDAARQALKVEVYGQAAAGIAHHGEFQPQKIFLPTEQMAALEHYSRKEGLRDISPAYHGTGQIGAERTRMANEGAGYLARSYFYRAGSTPEARFKGLHKYTAHVPERRLVDLATINGTPTEREQAAKKAGYAGFYNSESSMPEAVALFEPVKTDQQPRFSPRVWFSQMGNILAEKMPKTASKEQVRNILKSPGVKEDEVKWTGIQDYLDSAQEPVQKDLLLAWLELNDVKVNEVVKASDDWSIEPKIDLAEFVDRFNADGTHPDFPELKIEHTNPTNPETPYIIKIDGYPFEVGPNGDVREFDRFNEATEAAYELVVMDPIRDQQEQGGYVGKTQYEGYKLPGGENYTELLLTLPIEKGQNAINRTRFQQLADIEEGVPGRQRPRDLTPNEIAERDRLQEELRGTDNPYLRPENHYQSPHFDEPNILAHVRFDTRKDGAGKSILFLEEVQSDWHEQGREKGYLSDLTPEKYIKEGWTARFVDGLWEINAPNGRFVNAYGWDGKTITSEKEAFEEYAKPRYHTGAIPDAPFSKTWPELVMKRMLRWAAEHNYDRLAWTTGAQQNERYGLAKAVNSIEWTPGIDHGESPVGSTFVRLDMNSGREMRIHVDNDTRVVTSISGFSSELNGKNFNDVIGRELADKIMRTHHGSLQGEGLSIGGSGMKYFYDQMLPRFMEKYLKQFGAKVDALDIDLSGINGIDRSKVQTVHSIALTPEMKDSVINQGQPLFSPRVRQQTYPISQPGLLDRIIRVLQDKNIDTKRVVEDIEKFNQAPVTESLNPVLAEEMFQKRDEQRAKDFTNDELRPLLDKMRLNKITVKQLDDYLHARHVINDNVNARLQAINPDLAQSPNFDKLSGITDAEAQNILNNSNRPIMDRLAQEVDDMVETTRDLMVQYGLESQARIDEWRNTYQSYVPLRREGFDENGNPTGTGKSVRGSTVKQRGGSGLAVEHILANIAQTRDQIVSRGEKNRVTTAMAGLLMTNPNPDFAILDKPAPITYVNPSTGLPVTVPGNLTNYEVPTVRRFNKTTGVMQTYPDPMYKGRDNVVNFRVKGKDYAIVFNEQNERAMEVAKAFKNLGTLQLTGIMKAIAPYTRYLAAINTQYNPIFGIVNFVRDAQYAMLTLSSTPLQGKQATVLKNAIASLHGIYQDARSVRQGGQANSLTAQMWRRFEHVGGPTGYRDLFFSAAERADEIQRMMDPTSWKGTWNPQMLGRRVEETALFKWLSDYNLTMENSIRLGVFKTAVDSGLSDLKAASLAKNITVNFNKKGQIGAQMGSLYAFFNANVQGTARIAETLFEKTPNGFRLSSIGKKIVAGGILMGVLQTFALTMAGFDDDDPPEFVKQKNLVIPLGGKNYAQIPMPLGFNLLPNVGRLAAEVVKNGVTGKPLKVMEKIGSLVGAVYGGLSPVGGTGGLISEASPTVLDTFAALATNKDWTGKSIAKEDHSTLDPTPGHSRAHDTATAWAKALSYAINWATGGTDYTPGVLSPTPDQIDYLVNQATGGVGREIGKAAQLGQSLYTGEEMPTHKIPLVGRFYGSATGSSAVRTRFYEHVRQANIAYNEFEGRAKAHEDFSDWVKTHPEARFSKAAITVQKDLGILQKQKQMMLKQGASRDTIRLQEARITGLMSRFNDLVEKAQRP